MKQSPDALREGLLQRGDLEIALRNCTTAWNWTHQLHEFLGQSIPRVDDCRGLRTDAGTALTFGSHGVRAGTSLILRQRFLKLGVQVVATVRRWCCICRKHSLSRSLSSSRSSLGAQTGSSAARHSQIFLCPPVSSVSCEMRLELASTLESVSGSAQTPPDSPLSVVQKLFHSIACE